VRPRRQGLALLCGPSTSPLEAPLANARSELRAVAFSYALLGGLFFFFSASLVVFTWSGSWLRLWHDLSQYSANSVALFGGIAFGHWFLAGLSLRYLTVGPRWRGITLAASLFLVLWNIGGAARQTIVGVGTAQALSSIPAPTLLGAKWLIAAAYLICFHSLWKHRELLTNAWSGREI
jgi:hypothetical protein